MLQNFLNDFEYLFSKQMNFFIIFSSSALKLHTKHGGEFFLAATLYFFYFEKNSILLKLKICTSFATLPLPFLFHFYSFSLSFFLLPLLLFSIY